MISGLVSKTRHLADEFNARLKKWHKNFNHSDRAKRTLFIVASIIAGLLLVRFQIIPSITDKTSVSPIPAEAQQNSSSSNYNAPRQNNPLFATIPSWSQNFTNQGAKLDGRYWNVLVGPAENSNQEKQYYTNNPNNLRVENGALRLIATNDAQPGGYKYGSARIETQGKKSFLYGRIDIQAKMPSGVGTWPAVWMLPANNKYAQMSPPTNLLRYKNGGEIDIIEAVGFQPNINYAVAHTASDLQQRPDGTGSHNAVDVPGSAAGFNTYTLLWTPTKLTFAVNERAYFIYERQSGANYTTWPFDQPFYLIANLAMGGTWGGMDTAHFPGDGIDKSALPTSLDIRSIYYYPYMGSREAK